MQVTSTIKIVLADDHELFRDGFSVMVAKLRDIELVGEAADGYELLQKVDALQPDVVITDIRMPKLDGIAATRQLQETYPKLGVIALTNFEEQTMIVDMLEAGARGYLLKTARKEEIIEAVKTVSEGKNYYCDSTSPRLSELIAKSAFNPYRKSKKIEFNEREKEIICLICEGLTNKEIADRMFLSRRTIETHRENIKDRIGEPSTAALIVYAIRNGIFKI